MFSWIHKTLPLIYNDALSYMESISRLISKINQIINKINELSLALSTVSHELLNISKEIENIKENAGLSDDEKAAILQFARKAVYVDDNAPLYYLALEQAFNVETGDSQEV